MAKKYHVHERYKAQRRRLRLFFWLVIIAFALFATTALVRHAYYTSLEPVGTSAQEVEVTIPTGASVNNISLLLSKEHLIRSQWAFKLYIHNQDAANVLQAGTYQLRPNMGVDEIVSVLSHGKVVTNLVTIIPGQSLDQIKQVFLRAGFKQADIDDALDASSYGNDVPILIDKPASASLEGFLYPDSYQKNSTTSPRTIVLEAMNELQQHLDSNTRSAFAAQGLSAYQGLTLASIVEKEVSKPSDRAQVAQVFLTRLHQNISLGSDVTAFYGAALAGAKPSVTYDSPYNTRLHTGLPPTPIGSISQSSLDAVAHPATTDWLFFVAGDDGTTYFAHTNAEQDANVKQYCHTLCD